MYNTKSINRKHILLILLYQETGRINVENYEHNDLSGCGIKGTNEVSDTVIRQFLQTN